MKVRVLVVDDDPGTVEALALVLELEGFSVLTATGAADAARRVAQAKPDVIVCDLSLGPGGDGLSVARAVRADPALARTLLVGLSGSDTEEARSRARDAGFDHYLLKPVETRELLSLLPRAPGA